MSRVSNDVDVIVTTESGNIATAAFGIPTLVAESALASDDGGFVRWKQYGDLSEVAEDYANTTWAYKWAAALLSAETPPSVFAIALTATDDDNFTDSLEKVYINSEAYFCFSIESRTLQDAEDASVWAEPNKLHFVYSESTVVDIGESGTAGLGTSSFNAGRNHTGVFYHEDAGTIPTEANFIGAWIALSIGSWTAKFKDAIGLTPSKLNTSQAAASRALNVNTFVNVTYRKIQEGTNSAIFIDEVYGDAWIEARISESIQILQKQLDIIGYDDDGISLNDTAVIGVLDEGIDRGIITAHGFDEDGNRTGGFEVTSPKASEIPSSVKETREYDYTKFVYHKRVAMHKSVIRGVAKY